VQVEQKVMVQQVVLLEVQKVLTQFLMLILLLHPQVGGKAVEVLQE
tara:strand:+ start:19 stop:156 length:138 start_codon:yes stop_codon:yes gene_type:complete